AQLALVGKEAIGLKALQRSLPTGGTPPNWKDINDRLIASMETREATPEELFRVAVTAGEIQDKDQALQRLDALAMRTIPSDLAEDISAMRRIYAGELETLDTAARERLIAHHGFFGQLALTYGLPSNAQARESIEKTATSTLLLLIILSVGLL